MPRKSIAALLLIVGVLPLACNLVTRGAGATPEPSPTLAPLTVEPSVTPEPTIQPSPTPAPVHPTATGTATQALAFQPPFEGWPDEYQLIQVPPALQDLLNVGKASVVPLPGDKGTYSEAFARVVPDESLLGPYDFERLAAFKDQASFAAVPARNIPEVPDYLKQGVMVGLLYDANAFYGLARTAVYQVYFFDNRAEIRDLSGQVVKILRSGKDYFWSESKSNPQALTFFIKGSCWLCWNAGGRTGCLICF